METFSSVTDQCVISPLLLANIDPGATTHPDLRIELLGEPVHLGSEQYGGLIQQRGHPTDCRVSDKLLMAASQQYEQLSQQYEIYCTEEKLDELFLEASQPLDVEPRDNSMVAKPSGKQQVNIEPLDNPVVAKPSGKCQCCQPQSEKDIQAVKESCVPKKMLQNTGLWTLSIWREWATHRLDHPLSAENCRFCISFCKATLYSWYSFWHCY